MAGTSLLVRNASSVVTLASPGGPKRGAALNDLGERHGAAVAIRDGQILAVGAEREMARLLEADRPDVLDADGGLVTPGFVDPHTHLVFAGQRAEEFEARLVHGADYRSFVKAGAGGLGTVAATRATPTKELVALVQARLARMLESGTTTAEVKTGYGLSVDEEMRHLKVIRDASAASPLDIAPTLLAAHFRPPEHPNDVEPWLLAIEFEPAAAGGEPAAGHGRRRLLRAVDLLGRTSRDACFRPLPRAV